MALGVLSRFSSLTPSAGKDARHDHGLLFGTVHRCELPAQRRAPASGASFAAGSRGSAAFTVRGTRRAFLQNSSCTALLSVARPSSAGEVFSPPVPSASQRQPSAQEDVPVASGAQFRLPPPPTRVTAPGRVIAGNPTCRPRHRSCIVSFAPSTGEESDLVARPELPCRARRCISLEDVASLPPSAISG